MRVVQVRDDRMIPHFGFVVSLAHLDSHASSFPGPASTGARLQGSRRGCRIP